MPLKRCQRDGRPGYKWGDEGHCYTFDPGDALSPRWAREAARRQGRAIQADERKRRLGDIALECPAAREVHGIRTRYVDRSVGRRVRRAKGSDVMVELHVLVKGSMTVREGHRVAEDVKSRLIARGPGIVDAVVHIGPLDDGANGTLPATGAAGAVHIGPLDDGANGTLPATGAADAGEGAERHHRREEIPTARCRRA